MNAHWDKRFLDLAVYISDWSKDPSRKVGAVIARGKTVISIGFNGFPSGIDDDPERLNDKPSKYALIVHAEINAILNSFTDVRGCTLYSSLFTCNECAKLIIQSGISRVVCLEHHNPTWVDSFNLAKDMYREAGVAYE